MAKGPVTDDERSAIVEAIRKGTARNEIARQFERGVGTISRIALSEGLSFERAAETAAANEARQADLAIRRANLRDRLLDEAERTLAQFREPHVLIGWHQGVAHEHPIPEPDPKAKQHLALALAILIDKATVLDRQDSQDVTAVDAWLRSITGGAA
jgi:hypothetical protein